MRYSFKDFRSFKFFPTNVFCVHLNPNQSVRNKPSSLSYWLHGFASDSQDLPEDDDIIVSVGKGKPLVDEGVKPRPISLPNSKPLINQIQICCF